jgi:two-component system phosphate regulon sensor histidine kinase PhoR
MNNANKTSATAERRGALRARWLWALSALLFIASASLSRPSFAAPSGNETPAFAPPELRVVDIGNDTLAFIRTNPDGSDEALVADSRVLVDTLKARVLEARGLDEVAELGSISTNRRSLPSSADSSATTPYVFSHTFAAPFDSVRATLRLRPLADPDDGTLVAKLAILIPLCVLLGLIALYRLAAAQVRFAERRSNFVAAVSHELKTPLTAIRMHAEMLEENLVDGAPKRHEYYRTITRESERLSRLIDNVLTFAQLERKSHRLETRVGDISGVVRESIDVLRPHVQAHAFSIELELPSPVALLPDVRFEPDALKQVLFNLVDNALKYARDGSERRILVRCVPEAGGVALSVCDSGPGVRRDQLKTIFQPFFRGENELTRKNQGTGLGLSLVQGLASAMGATVRGENTNPGFAVHVHLVSR